MHKLTNMEAQRVITVLEDTLDRLTFLSYVPSSPDDDLMESLSLSGVVPPVYPTTVLSTPGRAANDSSGCQNQPIAKVAVWRCEDCSG